jgi:hypothetical protein
MRYSTESLTVSLTVALSDFLRSRGYDIYWVATQTTDVNTLGSLKATVTIVPEFPANPATIVRLKSDSAGNSEIVVPAMSLQIVGPPKRISILGLGHADYEWERELRVDGFASDEFQQMALMDLFHDWLSSEEDKALPVSDYSDPANPVVLDPVHVTYAEPDRLELYQGNDAVRYYVRLTATVRYIE